MKSLLTGRENQLSQHERKIKQQRQKRKNNNTRSFYEIMFMRSIILKHRTIVNCRSSVDLLFVFAFFSSLNFKSNFDMSILWSGFVCVCKFISFDICVNIVSQFVASINRQTVKDEIYSNRFFFFFFFSLLFSLRLIVFFAYWFTMFSHNFIAIVANNFHLLFKLNGKCPCSFHRKPFSCQQQNLQFKKERKKKIETKIKEFCALKRKMIAGEQPAFASRLKKKRWSYRQWNHLLNHYSVHMSQVTALSHFQRRITKQNRRMAICLSTTLSLHKNK